MVAPPSAILETADFETFYEEFAQKCIDEDSKKWRPAVMADKGTKIKDLVVTVLKAKYITPSMVIGSEMTKMDINDNEIIAKARGHVERCIRGVKEFRILSVGLHHRLQYFIDDIVYFCVFLTHYKHSASDKDDDVEDD